MSNLIVHGENGITYSLFSDLVSKNKVIDFLNYVRWKNKKFLKELVFEAVHLFPSFGRSRGLGEPDVIILTSKATFYIEVETSEISKLKAHFYKQLKNFIKLGNGILNSNNKKVQGRFLIENVPIRGKYRTRKLLKELLKEKRKPYYILISAGKPNELSTLNTYLAENGITSQNIGYISFRTIKRIPFISDTTKETINFNL